MATKLAAATANAAATAIGTLLNGGSVNIYTGSQPATGDTAASGTLLGTVTLSSTAFGSASSGTITANTITGDSSADNTGTAGWFRAFSSSSAAVIDGACGTSGADMNLNSTSIVAGGTIAWSSWTITVPTS